ncbi:MAG: hypothetical protein ACPGWR_12125 [Ardenticatenaceae bacterium]
MGKKDPKTSANLSVLGILAQIHNFLHVFFKSTPDLDRLYGSAIDAFTN